MIILTSNNSIQCKIPPIAIFTNELRIGANVIPIKTSVDLSNIHPNSHLKVLIIANNLFTNYNINY